MPVSITYMLVGNVSSRTNVATKASHKILAKCGFQRFLCFKEADMRAPGSMTNLVAYRYFPNPSTGVTPT
jgi:hypothetical protein